MAEPSTIEPFVWENFEARVVDLGPRILVRLMGDLSMRNPSEVFDPFVKRVHEALVAAKGQEIVLDFTQLKFMSSSGVKVFIDWIQRIKALPAPSRYKLRLQYDRGAEWQERSFKVMKLMAQDLLTLEPKVATAADGA